MHGIMHALNLFCLEKLHTVKEDPVHIPLTSELVAVTIIYPVMVRNLKYGFTM